MDSEVAEVYLRRAAEAALRDHAQDRFDAQARVGRIAGALAAVGAIDRDVAEAIESDVELALLARVAHEVQRRSRQVSFGAMVALRANSAVPPVASGPAVGPTRSAVTPATRRFVPINVLMPVDTDELRGDLSFLGYAHTDAGARLAVAGVLHEKRKRNLTRRPHPAFDFFHTIAGKDDQGNAYTVSDSVGGGDGGWSGTFELRPEPPPGIRWLEISSGGGPGVRIDLEAEVPAPRITVTESPRTPGEQYLYRLASGSLAYGFGKEGLPEIIDALRAVGALPADSPVPGQLTALLDGTEPAGGLPERWRLARESPVSVRAVAGLAIELPELDGMRITLLGLRDDGIQVHATGVSSSEDGLPPLWIRDQAGWHVTRHSSSGWGDGEMDADLRVEPPLGVGDWIEMVVAGNTTEVHAEVPVRWRTL